MCVTNRVGQEIYILAWAFIYVPTLCMRAAKALARWRTYAGSPESSVLAYAISTQIIFQSWVILYMLFANFFSCCLVSLKPIWLMSC